jgi:hypothetical protein
MFFKTALLSIILNMGIKVKKKMLFVMIINKYCMCLNFIRIKRMYYIRRTTQSRWTSRRLALKTFGNNE